MGQYGMPRSYLLLLVFGFVCRVRASDLKCVVTSCLCVVSEAFEHTSKTIQKILA